MFQSSSLVPDLQPPSFVVSRPLPERHRRDPCFDCVFAGTTKILFQRSNCSWKPDHHRSCHVPSCPDRKFCTRSHALHAPPGSSTHLHAPSRAPHALPRAVTRQVPLADVSPSDDITTTSFAEVTTTSSADVIITTSSADVDQH